jgi:predicted permease
MWGEIWRRLRVLFRRERFEGDLEEEMRSHLEMAAAENRENGMDAEEAHFAARRQFGNRTLLKETSRAQWGWTALEAFARDLSYGWRGLRRAPGFTAMALLTLAVGVGANAAMFSVLRAVLLRPLPYRDPGRLVMVWQIQQRAPDESQLVRPRRRTPPVQVLARWRERSRSWESLAGYSAQYLNLTGGGAAERVMALIVTANFFPTLGVTPARGRIFVPEEEQPGRGHAVILSDELWRTRFGADPAILGKTVSLDGEAYAIMGVLPAGLEPVLPTVNRRFDLYLTLDFAAKASLRLPVRVIGRLRTGAGLAAAQAEMEALAAGVRYEGPPGNPYTGVQCVPLTEEVTGGARPALLALAGAAASVLLIVCVNLAGLMLARAAARQREMGIRVALGAGRWRLARQLLAESLLLGLLGGAVGTVLARWMVDLIRALHPGHLPRLEQAAPDAVVFAFGLAISVAAGLLFGALPALTASRTNVEAALRQGGARSGDGRGRLRAALVAAEVALALVLATGAGLLLRSYLLLQAIAPGFASDRVLTMQIWFPERTYDEARRGGFLAQALERIRGLPSVEAAGAASWLPLAYDALMSTDVQVKGRPWEKINTLGVTPGYFQATGISLVAGRFLREGERRAFVVNEAFCKRYGLEPARVIGEQIVLYGKPRTVAGVVRDIRDLELARAAEPVAFVPYPDFPTLFVGLAVRTSSDPAKLVSAIRAEMRAIDPDQPVVRVQTMEQILSSAVARPRFNLTLLGAFAAVAVGLAAIGVYGVIAYLVSQRRNEIGVRMALGAQSGAVIRYVLARGMTPVAAGLVMGVAGALAATRVLRGLLYGIGPTDLVTFALAVLLLAAVALAACCVPARRAARIDPIEALRYE